MKSGIRMWVWAALLGCVLAVQVGAAQPDSTAPLRWWNDRVWYEIFVRSFYDSDGDGIGDLQGVIEQLDYLNDGDPNTTDDLGITGIWLMPVTEATSYHGYDTLDYRDIEQDYGTLDDMRALLDAAHERGIAVIIDLVMNHTARAHAWFRESAGRDALYDDWYVWAEEDPGWRGPDGQVVWHPYAGRYFYGVFWDGMPDLNLTNPDVTAELYAINDYWLNDVGVDGFRLDAIKHLIEEGSEQEDTAATLAWLREYAAYIDRIAPDALLVGEVWSNMFTASDYVEDGLVDLVFEFDLASAMLQSVMNEDASGLITLQNRANEQYPLNQYASFLTNHDQNRVMSQLNGNHNHARTAASLLLLGGGVPFIYYGEEIGMTGVKPDERIRTPMQWDGTPTTAGFTTRRTPWQPLGDGVDSGITVANQTDDPDSLLSHYRALIHLRQQVPALAHGLAYSLETSDRGIYAALRIGEDTLALVLINLTSTAFTEFTIEARQSPLRGPLDAGDRTVFGSDLDPSFTMPTLIVNEQGGFDATQPLPRLDAYSTVVIELASGA
jgi:glycosidase